jgi:predicted site-specific integrase-resolvase
LPVEAEQVATGTIIVKLESIPADPQRRSLRPRLFIGSEGRKIIVVDHSEVKDDLIRDMTEVLTSFCARLYGKRAARHKAEKAIKATQD